ncbi:MAG TPA: M48 family metallopeptidase, partial [Propylenella sp.]|nr:M48 family metallopeptidase [Propylenella sp.]
MQTGEAVYFNGSVALRHGVRIALEADGIIILDGEARSVWPYPGLRLADAPAGTLRLGADAAPELARLEIRDPALQAEVLRRAPALGRKRGDRADTAKIVFWSVAATVSLVLTVLFLVPLVVDRLAPLVPITVERRLGEAVDSQVRALFGSATCESEPGRTALAKLAEELSSAADLPMPVEIAVLDSETPNAVALPGGKVYVLAPLLAEAKNPDELAGVLAHELGHVARRDGLRKLLQTGGSSFLLGLLFGDVTGGAALVFAAQVLVDTRYSRGAERAADAFAAGLMLELGRSPEPLGAFLQRLDNGGDETFAFVMTHPVSSERMRALQAKAGPAGGAPLL